MASLLPRLAGTAALILALCAGAASTAVADSQQVEVQDNIFMRPGVAVKPGESVTWTYAGNTEQHNVNFEDGSFTMPAVPSVGLWTASRAFPAEGAYRYHCQVHGAPGGQGMSGIVYVNAAGSVPGIAPMASFTVSPGVAVVGQTVSFDAAGTSDPDSVIARHEWDLDGNGSYETGTGAMALVTEIYNTTGTRTVRLRVTDSQGLISETTRSVAVTQEPIASFTVTPTRAQAGQAVSIDGSASRDPDGTIARYQWDLDGNGSYETDTGTRPTTSRSYPSPAAVNVKLRVTDNLGRTSTTSRALEVIPAPQPLSTSPPPGCSNLIGARRATCIQKICRTLKRGWRAACIQKSCRWLRRTRRPPCIRKSCRYVTRAKRNACMRKSCRTLKPATKRACTRKYTQKR